ncbi:MAG: nuclear transport factor 2 family protein [Labilithrix sp.]
MHGDLAVVERWLEAVNRGDRAALLADSAEDIELKGPRGSQKGRDVLAAWLGRAGFTAQPRRWFSAADGRCVVEQEARWQGGETRRVASAFTVRDARVVRYERFDDLADALASERMELADEVLSHA